MSGYIIEHDGRQFDPNGAVAVDNAAEHNKQLEAAELEFWRGKPNAFLAYANDRGVTTWLGTPLGEIVVSSHHTNNLTGSRMRHIRVRGDNGATYHGTYGDAWGQCVTLRRCKP